jgi:hypothetical protein
MPIETPPRALASVAHLRVVHGHNTIQADSLLETSPVLSALHVLHQQPGKQPSRLMQPLRVLATVQARLLPEHCRHLFVDS